MNTTLRKVGIYASILIPLLSGIWVLGRLTQPGMAIYADSVVYICGARSIRAHHGFTLQSPDGTFERIHLFPPLYSAALAVASVPNHDVIKTARWLQVALFAIGMVFMMVFMGRGSEYSPPVIFLAGMSWVLATDSLSFDAIVLSECLFMTCSVMSLFFIYRFIETSKHSYLLLAAVATAGAGLTRYAGVAWMAAGALAILFWSAGSRQRRLRVGAIFLAVAAAGNIYWMERNHSGSQGLFGRPFHLTRFYGTAVNEALLNTFRLWTWRLSTHHQMILVALWSAFAVTFLITFTLHHAEHAMDDSAGSRASKLLLLYLGTYMGLILASAAFLQGDLLLDSTRILIPFHLFYLAFVILEGLRLVRELNWRWIGTFAGVISAGFLILGGRAVHKLILDSTIPDRLMYGAPQYLRSPTVQAIVSMPNAPVIYTNLSYPILLATNRQTYMLPKVIDNATEEPNPNLDAELNDMNDELKDGAILVYFDHGDLWISHPALPDLVHRFSLRRLAQYADGSIWASGSGS